MKIKGFFGSLIIEHDGMETEFAAAKLGYNELEHELNSNSYILNGVRYDLSDPYISFTGTVSELKEYMEKLEQKEKV